MAEGLLRSLAGDRFEVLSAGTEPKSLHPLAVEAMREIGVDISGHHSKSVSGLLGQRFHYVITVCDRAKEQCPIFPGAYKFMSWSFDDPAQAPGSEQERLRAFRQARDRMAERLKSELLA